ncbi:MAG: AAA family ATPase [Pirellulales bacterium]
MVAGGKGGVGATTVAMNLAAALADREHRVVVVDAARQHADLAQVAGIGPIAGGTVADVLAGKCSATEALAPGPAGTLLLANHWAPRSSPDCSRHAQQRLLTELQMLGQVADVLVVDVGSGLSAWTRRFWMRARMVIVVTTTDDVAVMDAYAAIKLGVAESLAGEIRVLANQCESDAIANDIAHRLSTACQRFLGCRVPALPALPQHLEVDTAGAARVPRVWESPNSPFAREVLWLAHAVDDVLTSKENNSKGGKLSTRSAVSMSRDS